MASVGARPQQGKSEPEPRFVDVEIVRHPSKGGRHSLRTFNVAASGELLYVHEGFGLEADEVIDWHARPGTLCEDKTEQANWDEAIYSGELLVAVVHQRGKLDNMKTVTRFNADGKVVRVATLLDLRENSDGEEDTIIHKPKPGRHPLRTFRVTQSGRYVEIHEGFGLETADVVAWLRHVVAGSKADLDRSRSLLSSPYSLAVYDGEALAAVLHVGADLSVRETYFDSDGHVVPEKGGA